MKQFKSDVVTVDSSPHKFCYQFQSLREEFIPYATHMPNECSVATLQILVNVDAGKAMSHLLPIMISNDLEIVPLIAFFHFLKQSWHVVE